MAIDPNPNFRVNVYGTDPTQVIDTDRMLPQTGGGRGGGKGYPFFKAIAALVANEVVDWHSGQLLKISDWRRRLTGQAPTLGWFMDIIAAD